MNKPSLQQIMNCMLLKDISIIYISKMYVKPDDIDVFLNIIGRTKLEVNVVTIELDNPKGIKIICE